VDDVNTKVSDISLPIPSAVIVVGDTLLQVAQQVRNIYFRGDHRRGVVTNFFHLRIHNNNEIQFQRLENGVGIKDGEDIEGQEVINDDIDPATIRRSTAQLGINKAEELHTYLERILHDLRIHERLVESGWAEIYNVPVNFFLIADARDPISAGLLIPLLCKLQEVVASTSLCQIHLLTSVAVFPRYLEQESLNQELLVYTFLKELEELLVPNSDKREILFTSLKMSFVDPLDMAVYLFDYRKEGTYVVENEEDLQLMVGNALLGLMHRDIARNMYARLTDLDITENRSFYNSIGTAGIFYDPNSLQSACVNRSAHQFLSQKILAEEENNQLIIDEATKIKKQIGGINDWLAVNIQKLEFPKGELSFNSHSSHYFCNFNDLAFNNLEYESIHDTCWVQNLSAYHQNLNTQSMPKIRTDLDLLTSNFISEVGDIFHSKIFRLPVNADLYPGGIQKSQQIFGVLEDWIDDLQINMNSLQVELQGINSHIIEKLTENYKEMNDLLLAAPHLPRLILIMPRVMRKWIIPIFYWLNYRKQIKVINKLRQECVELLQEWMGITVQEEALQRVNGLIPVLKSNIAGALQASEDLRLMFKEVQGSFDDEWEKFPLAAAENGWEKLFRIPVVDVKLADWAFQKWYPDLDEWKKAFFNEVELFEDWIATSAVDFTSWISSYSKDVYASLWDIELDEIFSFWNQPKHPLGENTSLDQQLIKTSINISVPLLHPDFDPGGGPGYSSVIQLALFCRPEWKFARLPEVSSITERWSTEYTGDPYMALFMQVRNAVSLEALQEMTWNGKTKFESMNKTEQQRFCILDTFGPLPPVTDILDPEDPDIVQKVFHWKFRPKGSSKEVEQSINLNISTKRFEYLRRHARFGNKWSCYAEMESPELHILAAQFQKLHTEQNWSTFNQAYNVLSFVQSCISYSKDIETTGHEDWARFPIETIMEETGDCEDVAILCASILARLGFQVVLILYKTDMYHLGFGVAGADSLKGEYVIDPNTGRKYYYGEATGESWHLGQIPHEYREIEPEELLPVNLLIDDEESKE